MRILQALALSTVTLWSTLSFAQPDALFQSEPRLQREARGGAAAPGHAQVDRQRFVRVNRGLLGKPTFRLELFDGQYVAVRDRIQKRAQDSFVWLGHLEGMPGSQVSIALHRNRVAGFITLNGQVIELSANRDGRQVLYEVNDAVLPELEPDALPAADSAEAGRAARAPLDGPLAGAIQQDLLLTFTQTACDQRGGCDYLEADLLAAVADANQAYANSGVGVVLNIVGMAPVDYTESGIVSSLYALTRQQGHADDPAGELDEVHALRDQTAADLVVMVTDDADYCGVGWVNARADTAFSVVRWSCLSNRSLTHEIGHNQGSAHNREHANAPGAFEFSYGHRVCDSENGFRTVMSYAPGCPVSRINHFSNPDVDFSGQATGIGEAENPASATDNARSLIQTAAAVSNFRQDPNAPIQQDAVAFQQHKIGDSVDLQLQAQSQDGSPLTWQAGGLPAGLSINTTTGLISGTVSEDAVGYYAVNVYASNGTATVGQPFDWRITRLDGTGGEPPSATTAQDCSNGVVGFIYYGDYTVGYVRPGCSLTPAPPTVDNPGTQHGTAGAANVQLQIEAMDPNGDGVTYSETGLPPGLSIAPDTGLISGNLGVNTVGQHAVTVTVTDDSAEAYSTDVEFTWNVSGRPPQIEGKDSEGRLPNRTRKNGLWMSVPIDATDPDGDIVAYSADNLPNGLTINASTGVISGRSNAPVGRYTVTVTVEDAGGLSDSAWFYWYVRNTAPVLAVVADQHSYEEESISFLLSAADPDRVVGDSHTFAANGLPGGLAINASTGRISGTVAAGASDGSPYDATVAVNDENGGSDSVAFTWTVSESVPLPQSCPAPSAAFTAFPESQLTKAPDSHFTDVPGSHAAHDWVESVYAAGVMGGCNVGSSSFCPSDEVTREQMAELLLKAAEGSAYRPPECKAGSEVFNDVPASNPFCPWIEELAIRGVTAGCSAGNYCPGEAVDQAELAAFLLQTLEGGDYEPPKAIGYFNDVAAGDEYADWIEESAARGVITGCGDSPPMYCPDDAVNRAQMAVFLVEAFDLPMPFYGQHTISALDVSAGVPELPPLRSSDEGERKAGDVQLQGMGSETVMALDWAERHEPNTALEPHDSTLLGDSIDPKSGRLTFEHVDVSLPGNSGLPVEVRRRLNPSQMQSGEFSDWQFAIPTISTKILATEWHAGDRWGKIRCSGSLQNAIPSASWPVLWGGSAIPANKYSDGVILDVPGRTTGQILDKTVSAGWPASADKVTADGWYLECISNIDGAGTEGFVAVAPNGDRYTFDVVVDPGTRRSEYDIWQVDLDTPGDPFVKWQEMGVHYDILGVSEVTDVHGNWVRYDYDANGRLATIEANDGRRIDIGREFRLIETVTANPGTADARQWSYAYGSKSVSSYAPPLDVNGPPGTHNETWSTLTEVTRPDGRKWQFDLANLQVRPVPGGIYDGHDCKQLTKSVGVTHPDGVTGTFTVEEFQLHLGAGATGSTGPYCPNTSLGNSPSTQVSDVMAVTRKSLSSPGIPTAVWEYDYISDGNEITTTIVRPDDTKQVLIHPTPFAFATPRTHAKLTEATIYPTPGSGTRVEVKAHTYLQESAAGSNFVLNSAMDTYRPVRNLESTLTRGADEYTTSYSYNTNRSSSTYSYGFPTRIETSSNLGGGTRVTDITYLKDANDWILGLKNTVTKNGKPFDDYGYDTKGRLTSHKRFGVTIATLGYHTSGAQAGQPSWHKDALNRETTFSSYHRGIPRTVTRADDTTFTRQVDANGWVTSETNPRGYTTGYQYNDVGRLTRINRPSPWTDTTINYQYSGSNLVQTANRGAERTRTTYDAMLRPTRVRQRDLNTGGDSIYTETDYDATGRVIFKSLPSASAGSSIGIETNYDALGRVTQTRETATGGGTTSYAYLSDNRTRVTDPEGNVTTTTRSGYGSPDDGNVVKVQKPEGITVDKDYDIYGNVEEISQAKGGGAWHVSSFDYDSRLRLCRRSVPETGDTLYAYNNADEMTAYAEGQSAGTGCATPPSASRVSLSYDDLGRLETTNYPSGTPDISRSYDANGNLKTINRGGVNWTYAYNSADLIGSEKLTLDGRTYQAANSWDNNERLTQKVFPSGNAYAYNNDGLGRPMCIEHNGGGYVRNVDWHPNGKIASLTRGNDEPYAQGLNARQLVDSISSYGETLNYFYDRNGRVTDIVAQLDSAYDRVFGYDGAGRLASAYGPWGTGSYAYDPLGNITRKQLGSRTVDIQYTGRNRVNRVRDTGVGSSWRSYSHDARGNVTNDGRHGFGYDFANQPTTLTGADGGSYSYDGNLKRVKQVVNGETIYSVYDRSGALLTRDNVTAGTETDYLSVAGQTFVRLKNGVATYPLNDHLGTALMVANQDGDISTTRMYQYTPFGETWGALSPPGENDEQGYTGHIEDATGLTYMQARYFDPVMGRFLSVDPVGYADQLNLYAYVSNDPINAIDPTGMCGINDNHPPTECESNNLPDEEVIVRAQKPNSDPNEGGFRYTWTDFFIDAAFVGADILTGPTPDVAVIGITARHAAKNAVKESAKQLKRLTKGEIKALKKRNIDPHDLKPNSRYDLFKDKDGNIYVKPKDGTGPGEPTGINLGGGG